MKHSIGARELEDSLIGSSGAYSRDRALGEGLSIVRESRTYS